MKRWMLAVVISAALSTSVMASPAAKLPHGMSLIETVKVADNAVGIPYKKYQLANGLTVILHQDHSDPLVHVDITYHVGSSRELSGHSGFAHLFEHMMFQGSEHVGDDQHIKIVMQAGGIMNGSTTADRTNYFETVPSNQLEKMLWLESDRMGYLLPALTKKKLEAQRETVKNERAQRIDNQPYGRMNELFDQAFYPEGHPYSWPVAGWSKDINRANVREVKNFFRRWYGPNNATLTIGGDFEEAQTLAWINKYFAGIPRGPEVKNNPKTLLTLDKTRYISMEDKVKLPLLRIAYPTVYANHKDEAALDLLANIIGGGTTSIVYKNLVKEGYAVQAGVSHSCQELACQFAIYALANPAKDRKLSDIERRIKESIAEFEQRGVTDDDLQKVKIQFKAGTIFGLQSVAGKVSTLAFNQTLFGNPNMIAHDLKRYASVTKADVMRVFNTYIKNKPMVVMSVVPEGQKQLIAHPDNYTVPVTKVAQDAVLAFKKTVAKPASFDRSIEPKAQVTPTIKVPKFWIDKLGNGIKVMGTISNETPTTELIIFLNGGHRLESVKQAGLASLTADLLNESTKKRSTEELAQALELLGSSVNFGASNYQSYVEISALSENIDKTLVIAQEMLSQPAFTTADFNRVKQQHLQTLKHLQTEPDYIANSGFNRLLFGANTQLGVGVLGTSDSVSALTVDDVKSFYKTQYSAGNAQIIAVGSLRQTQLMKKLAGFSHWSGKKTALPPLAALPKIVAGKVYIIDRPGATQSVIKIGDRALPYDATGEYFKSSLMNYPFGEAFNSRINLNLREDKGYTYGAKSYFSGGVEVGLFEASASVRRDVTAKALVEFANEINRYHASGMTTKELAFMRHSVTQSQALNYETPYQKAGFMRRIERYGLSTDFTQSQANIVNTISLIELNALAASKLDLTKMVILVVGDRAKIEPAIKAAGFSVAIVVNKN